MAVRIALECLGFMHFFAISLFFNSLGEPVSVFHR